MSTRQQQRVYEARYRTKHREYYAQLSREWLQNNRERKYKQNRDWIRNNYSKAQELWLRDGRAKRIGRNKESVEYVKILQFDPCCYCGGPMEHIDHIVPSVKGGSNVWNNLTAACRSCNCQKNDKRLLEFLYAKKTR